MATNEKRVRIEIVTEATGTGVADTTRDLGSLESQVQAIEQKFAQQAAGIEKSIDAYERQGTAAKKSGETITKQLDDAIERLPVVGQAYEFLKNPIGGAAVAAGALAIKIGEAASYAAKVEDLANQFGVNVEELQRAGNVAKYAGSSLERVATAFNLITKSSQQAIADGGDLAATYERLGLTVEELRGLSADQIFYEIADAVANSTDRNRTYADVLEVMGRSAGQLYETLQNGSAQIKAQGEGLGILSQEDIANLTEARDAIQQLNDRFTIFVGKVAGGALEISKTTNEMGALSLSAEVLQMNLQKLGVGLNFADPIDRGAEAFRGVLQAVDQVNFGLVDFERLILGAPPAVKNVAAATDEAATAAGKLGTAADEAASGLDAIDPGGIDTVKAAADAASAAVRELASASADLQSAQQRLQKAQFDSARAAIDLQQKSGQLTREQAAAAKQSLAEQERAAEVARERAQIQAELIAAQQSLATNQYEGATEAAVADQKRIETLRELLATLEQINAVEAGTSQTKIAAAGTTEARVEKEKQITTEKQAQAAATAAAAASEQAINAAQSGRASAPLQRSPIGPSNVDQPVDINRPAQPRGLGPELAPRGSQGAGTAGSAPAAEAAKQAATAIEAAGTAAAEAVKSSGDAAAEAVQAIGTAVVAKFQQVTANAQALTARIEALEARTT